MVELKKYTIKVTPSEGEPKMLEVKSFSKAEAIDNAISTIPPNLYPKETEILSVETVHSFPDFSKDERESLEGYWAIAGKIYFAKSIDGQEFLVDIQPIDNKEGSVIPVSLLKKAIPLKKDNK